MIRSPLGLRLDPDRPIKEQVRSAATAGARGIVFDASGDLGPNRLTETGRRELRHVLRSVELRLVAINLPTRRGFDTFDQLEDRIARADRVFSMAYDLGARQVLVNLGPMPGEDDAPRRSAIEAAVRDLADRADHRGVVLGVETGLADGATLRAFLETFGATSLAASVDPSALQEHGHDPVASVVALGTLVTHAYIAEERSASKGRGLDVRSRSARTAHGFDDESYLGALEEVGYQGCLTVWPDRGSDPFAAFKTVLDRVRRF